MSLNESPQKLYNVGLNYKKADINVRGAFSITKENQVLLLKEAKAKGCEGLFVVSTCNRTEITGFAEHPFELISLLVKYSKGKVEDFINVSNVYKNKEAVNHLFNIGVGLESQILGDYEIVSQLKNSFNQAKKIGTTNSYLERLINLVLQASKEVKNKTKLSSGTTSVSYAAVQYIMDTIPDYNNKKILNFGLGDIGKNTCKNILHYTKINDLTLINRTHHKAKNFKDKNPEIIIKNLSELNNELKNTDILIVSTGASYHTISQQDIQDGKTMLILDLSMPENVDKLLKERPEITLVNVDELSKITDKTIETRKKEIPLAQAIIDQHKQEFNDWISYRKFVPAVNALKESLQMIQGHEIDFHRKKINNFNEEHAELITSHMIQKITTQFVKHLKDDKTSVDQSIEVISKIFNLKELNLTEND